MTRSQPSESGASPYARRLESPSRCCSVQGGATSPVVSTLAEILPNAEALTVAGADHLLPLRDPATLAGIAAAFLAEHRILANV